MEISNLLILWICSIVLATAFGYVMGIPLRLRLEFEKERSIPEPPYIPPRPKSISGKDILEAMRQHERTMMDLGIIRPHRLNSAKVAAGRRRATAGIYGPWPKPKR